MNGRVLLNLMLIFLKFLFPSWPQSQELIGGADRQKTLHAQENNKIYFFVFFVKGLVIIFIKTYETERSIYPFYTVKVFRIHTTLE